MRTEDLFAFIKERYAILKRRQAGLPKPWTQDPILQNYRFCNVYREDDTVTKWIAERWRNPYKDDPDIWFAMALARYVNWPDTLDALCSYPVPWTDAQCGNFIHVLATRGEEGKKVWTGAYTIHAGTKGGSKIGHVAYDILTALWEKREYIRESRTCAQMHKRLMEFDGVGSFMAGQIVCDTKYTRLLDTAGDWWDFAAPGPGSRRGLARVFGYDPKHNWNDEMWLSGLLVLKSAISSLFADAGMPPIHAQDLQNCLCEFDKYERVRLGQGRPRSNYSGRTK